MVQSEVWKSPSSLPMGVAFTALRRRTHTQVFPQCRDITRESGEETGNQAGYCLVRVCYVAARSHFDEAGVLSHLKKLLSSNGDARLITLWVVGLFTG